MTTLSQTQTLGSFEAKTRLGEILARVDEGMAFIITRRDKPIARIIPYEQEREVQGLRDTVAMMKQERHRYALGKVRAKTLIEEGRA